MRSIDIFSDDLGFVLPIKKPKVNSGIILKNNFVIFLNL